MDELVPTNHDLIAWIRHLLHSTSVFCEFNRRENEAVILSIFTVVVLIMVPFNSLWKELSIGCHIFQRPVGDNFGCCCHKVNIWSPNHPSRTIEQLKGFPKRQVRVRAVYERSNGHCCVMLASKRVKMHLSKSECLLLIACCLLCKIALFTRPSATTAQLTTKYYHSCLPWMRCSKRFQNDDSCIQLISTNCSWLASNQRAGLHAVLTKCLFVNDTSHRCQKRFRKTLKNKL